MSRNSLASSSMKTRSNDINPHVQLMKQQQKRQQHPKIALHLHVKETLKKGKPDATIPLKTTPFIHNSLSGISQKKTWESVKLLILSVIKTEEFRKKFGDDAIFDSSRGILGWKGIRDFDQNPCSILQAKASVEIHNDEEWRTHFKSYCSRNEDEKDKDIKFLLLDLGIAVYDEMKENEKRSQNLMAKAAKEKRKQQASPSSSVSSLAQKKKKKSSRIVDVFKAPKVLLVGIVEPILFYAKENEVKTPKIDILGRLLIDFERFIEKPDSDNVSNSRDSESENVRDEMEKEIEILEDGEVDDEICSHIYEPIKHILGSHITKNIDSKCKKYKDMIGDKVSSSCILFLLL